MRKSVVIFGLFLAGCANTADYQQGTVSDEQFKKDYAECSGEPWDSEAVGDTIMLTVIGGVGALAPSSRVSGCMVQKGYDLRPGHAICEEGTSWDPGSNDCV